MLSFTDLPYVPFTVPAGTYAIGCLETVLSASPSYYQWSQFHGTRPGFFESEKEEYILVAPASAGNQIYTDSHGICYPVTNGTFGFASISLIISFATALDLEPRSLLHGLNLHTFVSPCKVHIEDGHFSFRSSETLLEVDTTVGDTGSVYYSDREEEE